MSSTRPYAPRDVLAQSGSRGALITWKLPEVNSDITGYRVYSPDETSLFTQISDKGNRQCWLDLSAGASPPWTPVFISCVNVYGSPNGESQKVQVMAQAAIEAGAPSNPSAPPGYTGESSGGGDTSSGRPTSGGTSA